MEAGAIYRKIKRTEIPNGTYRACHHGYQVSFSDSENRHHFIQVGQGCRGYSQVQVIIENGSIVIEEKQ